MGFWTEREEEGMNIGTGETPEEMERRKSKTMSHVATCIFI